MADVLHMNVNERALSQIPHTKSVVLGYGTSHVCEAGTRIEFRSKTRTKVCIINTVLHSATLGQYFGLMWKGLRPEAATHEEAYTLYSESRRWGSESVQANGGVVWYGLSDVRDAPAPVPAACIVATDGGCSGNHMTGVVRFGGTGVHFPDDPASPGQPCQWTTPHTGEGVTNNRMELLAVIEALEYVAGRCDVHVLSDSMYVIGGATTYMTGWIARGFRRVKNTDLWKRYLRIRTAHVIEVTFEHVRGHSGHILNEIADQLTQDGIAMARIE